MPAYQQKNSCLQVFSTLGDDSVIMNSFRGKEGISTPFHFVLDLFTTKETEDASKLLGKNISWLVSPKADSKGQWFDGKVFSVSQGQNSLNKTRSLTVQVVSWFFLLNQTKNRKVWVEKSVKDITEDVFKKYPDAKFELKLSETYKPLDCLIQCDQSDYDFLSWLWETNGIFYFFKFEKNKHTMVIGDSKTIFKDSSPSTLNYNPSGKFFGDIHEWNHDFKWVLGKTLTNDYNFEKPTSPLESKSNSSLTISGNTNYEYYQYPGGYSESADGKKASGLILNAEESQYESVTGKSAALGLNSGLKFKLKSHPITTEANKGYVVLEVGHIGNAEESSNTPIYENTFECFPDSVKFNPPQKAKKYLIPGIHNAIVVGPSGKEVFTDKYGRIKIQFIWDRDGKKDEKSSFWVRVSQMWAGKNFGFFNLPRIGEEVMVAFEEGDPSRPVVVGRLYNAEQKCPYVLPDNALTTGIKTHSSPKGATEDYNEIRFQDDKDKELLYIQANKDMKSYVKNDSSLTIDNKQFIQIKSDSSTIITEGKCIFQVQKGERTTTIKGNESLTVQSGDMTVKISSGSFSLNSAKEIELVVGGNTIKIDLKGIQIVAGPSSVKLDPSGVSIKGPMLDFAGSAMTKISGGITMIN
jgi:type VI secretion system secreted protein VgrG